MMESKFLSRFVIEDRTGEEGDIPSVYLIESLGFWSKQTGYTVWVPKMFLSDSASIPRALWSAYPAWGRWNRAAIVHDWLYTVQIIDRKEADLIFLDALRVCEVPLIRRNLFFRSVRLFGGCRWDGVQPSKIQIERERAHNLGGGCYK